MCIFEPAERSWLEAEAQADSALIPFYQGHTAVVANATSDGALLEPSVW